MKNLYSKIALPIILTGLCTNAMATENDIDDLLNMSLKDLTKVKVTSVSKKAEKASEAAAAITVVTQEDIKRSGANTIPEALRIVPGLQVAQVDSNKWIVTSRGFPSTSQFSNKMLVLIDGRSIYNPIFSGVIWDEQSTPLEDVERIEVIKGPGSTLWGANAVNGIINVITKSAKDTQDTLISAGYGNFEKANQYVRHGGKIGEDISYRAYVQDYAHGGSKNLDGTTRDDEWNTQKAGFKSEGKISETSSFELQGDVYEGERDEVFDNIPINNASLVTTLSSTHKTKGGNIIGKYSNQLSADSQLDIQLYYDYSSRDVSLLKAAINTVDLDVQHSFKLGESNEFVWGGGYRLISANETGSTYLILDPSDTNNVSNLYSAFVQDKIQLVPQKLYLTLGSKFEHNAYTGMEYQPNIRLAWTPEENQTIWGAVTRSVRTPSQIERDITQVLAATPLGGGAYGYVKGVDDDYFKSESLIAYELGYKTQPTDNTAIDIAAYFNDYDSLRTLEGAGLNRTPQNRAEATAKGFEVAASWAPNKDWDLAMGYSYIDVDTKLDSSSTDSTKITKNTDGRTPQNMVNLRSHYNIAENIKLDNALYFYDDINKTDIAGAGSIKDYTRFDTQVSYEPMEGITLSLIGQNLLDNQHQEYIRASYNSTSEIPRSVFGKVTLRF